MLAFPHSILAHNHFDHAPTLPPSPLTPVRLVPHLAGNCPSESRCQSAPSSCLVNSHKVKS